MALVAAQAQESVREIATCRSCGSADLEEVLDLGDLYISNFVDDPGQGRKAPLVVVQCRACSLAQLRHTVPSSWHYEGGYWYKSGTNEQMRGQLEDIVLDTLERCPVAAGNIVVDIGSNDGTMLRMFPQESVRIGFDPAENLVEEAMRGGNHIFTQFFPPDPATVVLDMTPARTTGRFVLIPPINVAVGDDGYKANAMTAIACFYDLDDPNRFVEAIKAWLHPDGLFVIQMSYAPAMLRTNDIGNIAHEHLEYYTVKSLAHLLNRHGLMIEDVSFNDVNGGSFRIFIRHGTDGVQDDSPGTELDWQAFARRVKRNKERTLNLLQTYATLGETVYGYGASTRNNTLLQAYGIGPDLITAFAERDPRKWGKRTVGSNIPIISEDEMRAAKPDYLFIGPWHLLESFQQRESEYRGRMIVPLPEVRLA